MLPPLRLEVMQHCLPRAVDLGCRCWRRGGRRLVIRVCDDS